LSFIKSADSWDIRDELANSSCPGRRGPHRLPLHFQEAEIFLWRQLFMSFKSGKKIKLIAIHDSSSLG
jgi:hypothetical protein